MKVNKIVTTILAMAICVLSAANISFADESPVAAALQPFVESNSLAGAVTVVVGPDGIIRQDAVGYADVANKTPMKEDSVFWIASMTKPITAVAFMMLVDEGKVSLDDPVNKYIPSMNNLWVVKSKSDTAVTLEKQKRPITLRHLLSHTSGLPFLTPLLTKDLASLSPENVVLTFTMNPLLFQPGEGYQYSNEGIDTIGRVIEIVSGMPYEKFLQTRIFDPLGMKETTFFPNAAQLKRLAKYYGPNAEKNGLEEVSLPFLELPFDRSCRYPEAGGGLFSTGPDLARFCQMLLNEGALDGKRYISVAALNELRKKQTGNQKDNYGLGFAVDHDGRVAFGHGGAAGTNMTVYPQKKVALIWLIQHKGFPGNGQKAQGAFNGAAFRLAPVSK